uniref:C1q domain-containing protein n=1 Tax=Neogobius melanostomus TaxID=47308 RepID=A0A8C6SLY8_9GOBI
FYCVFVTNFHHFLMCFIALLLHFHPHFCLIFFAILTLFSRSFLIWVKPNWRKCFLCFSVGQVAFSASLLTSGAGHTGPFNAFTPLVFRHVISNIGNAYSPTTGFFLAPVRGAYHFEFYIAALGSTHNSGAGLLKNGEHVVVAYETEATSWGQSANGATLLLEANDVVSLRLWVHSRIYENENRHNTFSGLNQINIGDNII